MARAVLATQHCIFPARTAAKVSPRSPRPPRTGTRSKCLGEQRSPERAGDAPVYVREVRVTNVHEGSDPPKPEPEPRVPALINGINWYCYTVFGLLFMVDFTPLGQLIQAQSSSGAWLCGMQWALCVAPTAVYCSQQGWDPVQVFKLRATSARWLATGSVAGVLVWGSVAAAISLKTGVALMQPMDPTGGAPSVMAQLFSLPTTPTDWATLLVTAAISPAVAEELLFRGFLLTSLQQRFGRVDAFMVAAAMFAAIHLSVEQFFPFCVLGIACGAVATASESILPAVALHATHNAAALVAGVLLRGS